MSKPDWKTKPHERKRMTLQQENQALKARIDVLVHEREQYLKSARHFRDKAHEHEGDSERYRVLRTKDVMVLDGEPKYLKREDLDKYCDEENRKFWGVTGLSARLARMVNGGAMQTTPTKLVLNPSMWAAAQKILKEERDGNDTGSESKEADQKDSGHHTDVLRYADWYGLWKQRSA